MREKEHWMIKGGKVIALGKSGVITALQENHLKGKDYVYYINVKILGQKFSGKYHPSDVNELETEQNN